MTGKTSFQGFYNLETFLKWLKSHRNHGNLGTLNFTSMHRQGVHAWGQNSTLSIILSSPTSLSANGIAPPSDEDVGSSLKDWGYLESIGETLQREAHTMHLGMHSQGFASNGRSDMLLPPLHLPHWQMQVEGGSSSHSPHCCVPPPSYARMRWRWLTYFPHLSHPSIPCFTWLEDTLIPSCMQEQDENESEVCLQLEFVLPTLSAHSRKLKLGHITFFAATSALPHSQEWIEGGLLLSTSQSTAHPHCNGPAPEQLKGDA
ncbi:hypothetical protein CPB84DRAFT_1879175 [Gymnopilus junonius]|uniref:Uncharacterized protein n=1 Tax=Gymnopilus junonius TaxID=109634 RepID=A0A9P5NB51_GYMJU|nr:hypothetical protein CPB84DRAFT_1879175 [Gymnopilus junonius]